MWKNGRNAGVVSPRPISTHCRHWSILATRLRWLSITPLGNPVVPEEYGSTRICSSRSTGACASSGAPISALSGVTPSASPITTSSFTRVPTMAARAVSRNSGMVISISAPESFIWCVTSAAV